MILLIDNYDSFVYNLARHIQKLGQPTVVVRNDAIDGERIRQLQPQAIVLSPGPCTPQEAGQSLEIAREFGRAIPMLGVCLGHQVIASAFGADVVRAPEPMHGRTSAVQHEATGLFAGLPNPLTVCRYHSLIAEPQSLARQFHITAETSDHIPMALQHREAATLLGVQFHPEAILTEGGYHLLANFLTIAGCSDVTPDVRAERKQHGAAPPSPPDSPITF